MLNQKSKWNLLRDFQRPLHLVHRFYQTRTVDRRQVNGRRSGAAPLVVGIKWRVHRMQRHAAAAKPLGNFFYVRFAVGVVDMLPGGKNLDGLYAAASQAIQNARMEPLFYIQIG